MKLLLWHMVILNMYTGFEKVALVLNLVLVFQSKEFCSIALRKYLFSAFFLPAKRILYAEIEILKLLIQLHILQLCLLDLLFELFTCINLSLLVHISSLCTLSNVLDLTREDNGQRINLPKHNLYQ